MALRGRIAHERATRPDVMLLGARQPDRALLRAQLIEEGYEVIAIDEWPMPRLYRRPEMKPRMMIVDLRDLPKPRETLEQITWVIPAERVLIVSALGTVPARDLRQIGFAVIERPATVGTIASAAGALLSR